MLDFDIAVRAVWLADVSNTPSGRDTSICFLMKFEIDM
jgi:hypothetical protein